MMSFPIPKLPTWLIPSAKLRITLTYLWRHGRLPNISAPRRFTEFVQHRKLHERNPLMPLLADKVAVKTRVAKHIGGDWIIPTIWHGMELPEKPGWPLPIIIKSRHGCNQNIICHDYDNWQDIRMKTARWSERAYGSWLDEWAYKDIEKGLIVEPYLGAPEALPVDYKFYVFGGKVTYIQVHLDRAKDHRWILFNPGWTRFSARTGEPDPPCPENLPAMIAAAEKLAGNFDFIRADFYEIGGNPLFGEITFYPGSGLDPFDPPSLDRVIGGHWAAALSQSQRYRAPFPEAVRTPALSPILNIASTGFEEA